MYRGQYMLTDVRKLQLKYTISCYQKYVDKEVTTIKNKTKQKRETSNIALKELVKVDCRLPVRVMWQKLNIKVIQPFVRE